MYEVNLYQPLRYFRQVNDCILVYHAPQTASPGTDVLRMRATMRPYRPCNVSLTPTPEYAIAYNDLTID
jgi:hypothetical protein